MWIFCSDNPKTWSFLIPILEFCHNQRLHSTTKKLPFFLMMGYESWDLPMAFNRMNVPTAEERLRTLKEAQNKATAAHELARQKMAAHSTCGFTPFNLKDKVWLDRRNLKPGLPYWKFAPKCFGPFKITEVLGPVSYHLQLPGTWCIHPVFHAILVSPYLETTVHGPNYTRPPPDLIEGEEQYEVKAIQGYKRWGHGYWYLVKWVNYPMSDNTWQSAEDLKDAPEILSEYQHSHNLWSIPYYPHILSSSSCLHPLLLLQARTNPISTPTTLSTANRGSADNS